MRSRLAAISVDLDEIPCYAAIHGIESPDDDRRHAVYRKALPRFEALLGELKLAATFFVIGRDMQDEQARESVVRLVAQGHEVASHSFGHLYDLTRRDDTEVRRDIEAGIEILEEVTGSAPRGFRAPGYTIDDRIFQILLDLGMRYDSSVFPCPPYYTAKAIALASIRLRGRRSHSILDDARVLSAPADPYRVGKPYWQRGAGMAELPIGVTGALSGRLPYIGGSLILAGARGTALLSRLMVGRPLVNLEFHGIDLADTDSDDLQFLRPHQQDLRRPLAAKIEVLETAVRVLREANYEFVTLEQAAQRLLGQG